MAQVFEANRHEADNHEADTYKNDSHKANSHRDQQWKLKMRPTTKYETNSSRVHSFAHNSAIYGLDFLNFEIPWMHLLVG